jgi:hypothetical protein
MKYGFNDIALDVFGYAMIGLSVWKLFTIEDLTIEKSLPYLLISAVGVVFVAFTIKKVANKIWANADKYIKNKTK